MGCECEHSKDVGRLKEAVFGNGKPQEALLTRVADVDKRISRIEKIGITIVLLLMLAVGQQFLDMIRVQPNTHMVGPAVSPAAINESP